MIILSPGWYDALLVLAVIPLEFWPYTFPIKTRETNMMKKLLKLPSTFTVEIVL